MTDEKSDGRPLTDLISFGSEIAGATSGVAIGLIAGGPAGAILGAVGGPLVARVFQKLAADVMQRQLSPREACRIGAVAAFGILKIREGIEQGASVRNDGFFESGISERAAAEEVFEGVMYAAQREHEEKKLKFMANLLANLAFRPEIDKAHANVLIRLVEDLSYRQLCLLAIFAKKNVFLSQIDQVSKVDEPELLGLLQEIYDLHSKRLIRQGGQSISDMKKIVPRNTTTQLTGVTLYILMDLGDIDPDDLELLAKPLRTYMQPKGRGLRP